MVKSKNELKEFIANIPDAKLTGFPSSETTVYNNRNLRLDMQTVCTVIHRKERRLETHS